MFEYQQTLHLPAIAAGDAVEIAVIPITRILPTCGLIVGTGTAVQAAVMAWVDALVEGEHVGREARATTRHNGFESHKCCDAHTKTSQKQQQQHKYTLIVQRKWSEDFIYGCQHSVCMADKGSSGGICQPEGFGNLGLAARDMWRFKLPYGPGA